MDEATFHRDMAFYAERWPVFGDADFESTAWWPIPDYSAGGYEFGDAMEVRCPHRWVEGKYHKALVSLTPDGRPRVSLGCTSVAMARIVASIIHGLCPQKMLVRHLDDDVANNFASNLAYGTQRDNIADSLRNGTFPIGERNGRARLNKAAVREIRRKGGPVVELAREHGVDPKTIRLVLKRESWAHLD